MINLDDLISGNGFVRYIKGLAHKTSPNAAILFGQLISSKKYFEDRNMLTRFEGYSTCDFFFVEQDYIFQETALSDYQQKKACDQLEKEGYLITIMKGLPRKKYYHITSKIYRDLLEKIEEKVQSDHNPSFSDYRNEETPIKESKKLGNSNPRNSDAINKILKQDIKKQEINKKDIYIKDVNKETELTDEQVNKIYLIYAKKGISKELFKRAYAEYRKNIKTTKIKKTHSAYFKGILKRILENKNGAGNTEDIDSDLETLKVKGMY
jgi:DNA-binding PadR family transcriptional regulator